MSVRLTVRGSRRLRVRPPGWAQGERYPRIPSGNHSWQWKISMNGGFIGKSLINGPFSIAMFDYGRVVHT